MTKVAGPSHEQVRKRADALERQAGAAMRTTMRVVVSQFKGHVTVDDLGRLMPEWSTHVDELLGGVADAWQLGVATTRAAQHRAIADVRRAALTAAADDVEDFEIPVVPSVHAEQLLANARNRLVNVGNEAWEEARGQLLTGLQAGESIRELSARLIGGGFGQARAELVARTEVGHAMNQGSLAQMGSLGVSGMTKTWLTVMDARTRPEHAEVNDETVPLNGTFSIGEEPGDAPNCRCTLTYDLPDDAALGF